MELLWELLHDFVNLVFGISYVVCVSVSLGLCFMLLHVVKGVVQLSGVAADLVSDVVAKLVACVTLYWILYW